MALSLEVLALTSGSRSRTRREQVIASNTTTLIRSVGRMIILFLTGYFPRSPAVSTVPYPLLYLLQPQPQKDGQPFRSAEYYGSDYPLSSILRYPCLRAHRFLAPSFSSYISESGGSSRSVSAPTTPHHSMRLSPAFRLLFQTPIRRYTTAATMSKYVKRITVSHHLPILDAILTTLLVRVILCTDCTGLSFPEQPSVPKPISLVLPCFFTTDRPTYHRDPEM